MSGLPKQPISWPITGGIATKNAPIMLQPGSNLALDNVRQERLNEWRTRSGNTTNVADDLPGGNVPVIATEAPWGGIIGLTRETGSATAARAYTPDAGLTAASSRWVSPPLNFVTLQQSCAQTTPGIWGRTSVAPMASVSARPSAYSIAEGGGLRLTAWWSRVANSGVQVSLTSPDGTSLFYSSNFAVATAVRPQCVYCPTANVISLFVVDAPSGSVSVTRWDCATRVLLGSRIITTNAYNVGDGSGSYLTALCYGTSATISVAYRRVTAGFAMVEYNPTTDAIITNVTFPATDASGNLQLLPDPDNTTGASARYLCLTQAGPAVTILRLDTALAILTSDLVDSVDALNVAGVAYQSQGGTPGWMVVYCTAAAPFLRAVKKRNGTISAVKNITPAAFTQAMSLATNAWREPSTDSMRYVAALTGASGDLQASFYEMALEWENGAATISNYWTEPQARMIPLNAGGGWVERGAVPQVQRTGTDQFSTCLPRITRENLVADTSGSNMFSYAIDRWAVQYMNGTTYTGKNQGTGAQTQQCAYLPVGSLLQTATGQLLCAHGASALPFAVVLTPATSVGGGLTTTKQYSYVTTVEMTDEAGNKWESQPSNPTIHRLAGTENEFSVAMQFFPWENAIRQRTVKLWRTVGDGSAYKLLYSVTGSIADTTNITYVDDISDVNLLNGEPISAEQQGTVTPAALHVVPWNRRLWLVERDFPTRVRFSKPIQQGRSPVFPADFYITIDDEHGALTKAEAMDDRIVATKSAAAYIVAGDGPDNLGNGAYPSFVRISSETGCIPGGPSLSTGSEVYMTSAGGVWRVNRGQAFDFVGSAIDQYLSMPLVTSPETVTGIVLSPAKNEVRVQTTHYRFVHDRIFNLWERDTGGFLAGTVVMTKKLGENTQCFFTSDGHMWIEAADAVAPTDAGTTYQGVIRSPWVRASGVGGWLRIYKARIEGTVTTTATATGARFRVYRNENDALSESWTPAGNIAAVVGLIRAEVRPKWQRVSSFSLEFTLPTGDATVRLEEWWALVAPKSGMPPSLPSERWV